MQRSVAGQSPQDFPTSAPAQAAQTVLPLTSTPPSAPPAAATSQPSGAVVINTSSNVPDVRYGLDFIEKIAEDVKNNPNAAIEAIKHVFGDYLFWYYAHQGQEQMINDLRSIAREVTVGACQVQHVIDAYGLRLAKLTSKAQSILDGVPAEDLAARVEVWPRPEIHGPRLIIKAMYRLQGIGLYGMNAQLFRLHIEVNGDKRDRNGKPIRAGTYFVTREMLALMGTDYAEKDHLKESQLDKVTNVYYALASHEFS